NRVSFGLKQTQQYDQTIHGSFMKYVKETYVTKLGGDISLNTFDQWAETLASNPVVIKLGIKSMLDLLSETRFLNDENIVEKRKLIAKALDSYVKQPTFCYSNCSSHGDCQPSTVGFFPSHNTTRLPRTYPHHVPTGLVRLSMLLFGI
ncbi:unnamed protein product, partial [Rotaria sp. Silwood2]